MRTVVALILAVAGCSRTDPVATSTAPPVPSGPTAKDEADDAVATLRAYYPLGQLVGHQDFMWATCHDETKGYAALLTCERGVVAEIGAAVARTPAATSAKLPCGKEIETAHRLYLKAQPAFHSDHLKWLESMRARLTARMVGRSQSDACGDDDKLCSGEPMDTDTKYGPDYHGASYSRVNTVECTKRLFECEPPVGNECWIGKVADRLGLGEKPAFGTLRVRSTGESLR